MNEIEKSHTAMIKSVPLCTKYSGMNSLNFPRQSKVNCQSSFVLWHFPLIRLTIANLTLYAFLMTFDHIEFPVNINQVHLAVIEVGTSVFNM